MQRIEIGRLGKPYGMEGGLKFRGEPLIFELEKVYLEGLGYRAIEAVEELNQEMVLYLVGLQGRAEAEALGGLRVFADRQDLPRLGEGEYYFFELVGRPVFVDGQPFGEVVAVEDGPQNLLVVRPSGTSLRAQSQTHLVPLQAPYVHLLEDGIHIEAIPGLFG